MQYRREVDGLRAVAVMPVLFFHANFSLFSGGYVGVDVFFVISGYLITSILLNDISKDQFSLVTFYERRARRILPALFTVILFSSILAWQWLLPSDLINFSQSVIAVVLFVSNIFFWLDINYFDTAVELKPLLHTWSLAVEEQYYILFPPALWLMWRLGLLPVIVSPPPRNGEDLGRCAIKTYFYVEATTACDFHLSENNKLHAKINSLLRKLEADTSIIWLDAFICPKQHCQVINGATLLYRDQGHLSVEGAQYIGKKYKLYQLLKNSATAI